MQDSNLNPMVILLELPFMLRIVLINMVRNIADLSSSVFIGLGLSV